MAPDVLKQVLLSLVQNAREAMPERGSVEITLEQRPSGVFIDVADEGTGLRDDVLPRVFDPFFTTKGGVQGVGLGLFIAEGLVRRSGGRLTAANRPDARGARFRIELPATTGASAAGPGEEGQERLVGSRARTRGSRQSRAREEDA
jgi:two-component system NtrC family sensor kinase